MATDGVSTAEGRLATYYTAQGAKRRASNTKKRAPAPQNWPHKLPKPEDLADAGFLFAPSATSPDSVKCFECAVQLDGWESGDNPAKEHYTHSPNCGWAINCWLKSVFESHGTVDDDPMSEKYYNARTATFQNAWPHENKRGWKCKTAKLVEAGWYFDPSPALEDGVSCAYCSLSIGGWEPKDDPTQEHKRRQSQCPFFIFSEKYAASRPKTKRTVSRQKKAARVSTQTNPTSLLADSATASMDNMDLDSSMATVMTSISVATSTKSGKTRKAPAPRGTKKKYVFATEAGIESQEPTEEAKPPRQTRRNISQTNNPPPPQPKKTRTKKKPDPPISPIIEPVLNKGKKRLSDGSEKEEDLSSHDSTVIYTPRDAEPRGKKRTSDGLLAKVLKPQNAPPTLGANVHTAVEVLEDAPEIFVDEHDRPKRKRAKKQSSAGATPPPARVFSKAKKGKNARKPLAEIPVQPEGSPVPMETDMQRISTLDMAAKVAVTSTPKQNTPEISADGNSTPPSSPTPARPPPACQRNLARNRSNLTPKPHKVMTPSQSPQASDVENQPPSKRLPQDVQGLQLKPISPLRPALQPLSAASPRRSPHKRGVVGKIETEFAWSRMVLDDIFMDHSPYKMGFRGKENAISRIDEDLDMNMLDGDELPGIVEAVRASLSDAEMDMTVEQWIQFNAERGMHKYREECERLVTMFEREAARARSALEGIVTRR